MTDVDAVARECAERGLRALAENAGGNLQFEVSDATDLSAFIAVALRSRDAEWKAEISRLTELPDDVRSCGELSCDDCNARTAQLRAENERLKDDYQVAVNNIAYRSEELVEANREIERLKALDKDYCDSANKYAQEIGRLREQLATSRAAAEAMEWLEAHGYELQCVYVVKEGKPPEFVKSWKLENYSGRYPTPTAAILAAKAASGTTKGGE